MIKKKFYLYILALLNPICLYSQITVNGKISGLPAKKIYLIEAYSAKILDSTTYNGHFFILKYKKKKGFEPMLVSLVFYNKDKIMQVLGYQNSYAGLHMGSTAFMLENGLTKITGVFKETYHNTTNPFILVAGEQTKAYFNTDRLDFGYISENDSIKRIKKINNYIKIIKTYPNSYFLISLLNNYRLLYTKDELKKLANCFTSELKASENGIKVFKTINILSSNNILTNLTVSTIDGKKVNVLGNTNQTHVLIFWASWCGPCRQEIPFFKKIYKQIKQKNISFSSISIDKDKSSWIKALNFEKMNWNQYIVESDANEIQDTFRFSSIPFLAIIKNGKIIKKYVGNEESNYASITNFIDKL